MSRAELDRLFYADSDEGEDKDDEGGAGGEDSKDKQPSDLDKLRSEKDKQIADLQKQLKDLQGKVEQSTRSSTQASVYNAAIDAVNKLIDEIEDEKEPEAAIKKAVGHLEALGAKYAESVTSVYQFQGLYKGAMADALAAEIQFEGGGDVATYKARLMKATDAGSMREIAAAIKSEVGSRKSNGRNTENNGANQRRSPDGGAGAPARTPLLNQMAEIDVTTPEGRAEWEKRRGEFRRALANR